MALTVVRRPNGAAHRSAQPMQPFRELEQLQEQTQQLVESLLGGAPVAPQAWVPPVDIEETEDAWIVEAEIPGAQTADINVDVRGDELAITGEIKERERKGILRRRTRRVGEFEFRMTLPGQVDADKVEADFDDGVLTVRIPRTDRADARHVAVGSGRRSGAGGAGGGGAGSTPPS